ncbi:homoserine O-acetyltransferase [Lactarius tabidus]
MGGAMQSLASGWMFPKHAGKVVSISGTARSGPLNHRASPYVLMADPNGKYELYYDRLPPHIGSKLAPTNLLRNRNNYLSRSYRSGPECDIFFGRKLRESLETVGRRTPALCPDFLIETYLDHPYPNPQGEQFCLAYDANSLISLNNLSKNSASPITPAPPATGASGPVRAHPPLPNPPPHLPALAKGLCPLTHTPNSHPRRAVRHIVPSRAATGTGVRMAGNSRVRYYELGGV